MFLKFRVKCTLLFTTLDIFARFFIFLLKVSKMYRRQPTTADFLKELALDSNSDMEHADTDESADFIPNESDSK